MTHLSHTLDLVFLSSGLFFLLNTVCIIEILVNGGRTCTVGERLSVIFVICSPSAIFLLSKDTVCALPTDVLDLATHQETQT